VKGDVDPFVVTQPQVGKKVVVEHVLCTVTVITSVNSVISRAHARPVAAQPHLAQEYRKIWWKLCPAR
jgi:hypothetical protein